MKIKQLKEILILGNRCDVKWDKKNYGGSFDMNEQKIVIGSKCIDTNPEYTFSVLMHEISECIHTVLCTRYQDNSVSNNHKFFMDHKEFQNHNTILSEIILKFIE